MLKYIISSYLIERLLNQKLTMTLKFDEFNQGLWKALITRLQKKRKVAITPAFLIDCRNQLNLFDLAFKEYKHKNKQLALKSIKT